MGRTGVGKTTLMETICGLRPVDRGRIWLLDREVTALKPAERGIGFVPQEGALFETMTVREQLGFALDCPPAHASRNRPPRRRIGRFAGNPPFARSQTRRAERRRASAGGARPSIGGPAGCAVPGRALKCTRRRHAGRNVWTAVVGPAGCGRHNAAHHPQPQRGDSARRRGAPHGGWPDTPDRSRRS